MRVVAALCFLAAACGSRAVEVSPNGADASLADVAAPDARPDTGAPPSGTRTGFLRSDCAPNDAPATSLWIGTQAGATCDSSTDGPAEFHVQSWEANFDHPSTYGIGDGSISSGSSATYCPSGGTCVVARSGDILVISITDAGARGIITLRLPDDSSVSAVFNVTRCTGTAMCG